MNSIKFTVPGRATPAMRMTQKSKWTPTALRYLSYKESVGWYAKRSAAGVMLYGNVKVDIIVYITNSRRGDIDNLCKSILDGCNNICYKDDRQVVKLNAEIIKAKTDEQRVEVEIQPA